MVFEALVFKVKKTDNCRLENLSENLFPRISTFKSI
jgi:hypothetical protein